MTLDRGFKGSAAKLDADQKWIFSLANNIPYILCNCFWMLSLLRLMYCTAVSTVSSDYKTSVTARGSRELFKAKLCGSLSE